VLLITALAPTLCNSKMVVLSRHKYVDVATCNNYVVGYTVGSRALSATRYIFFLHCLEHYLRKLAPGSDKLLYRFHEDSDGAANPRYNNIFPTPRRCLQCKRSTRWIIHSSLATFHVHLSRENRHCM